MDRSSVLPADVLAFIEDQIDSVPHLEALLLLWESAPDRWDADRIAARIYVAPDTADQILRDLASRGLVSMNGEGFSYDPAWDERSGLMSRVAGVYRKNLILVAHSIHSKPSAAVREFARAFSIKKD